MRKSKASKKNEITPKIMASKILNEKKYFFFIVEESRQNVFLQKDCVIN